MGCHLTLGSVSRNETDPHVAFVPLTMTGTHGPPDVHLRAAWRTDDTSPAVRAVVDALLGLAADEPA